MRTKLSRLHSEPSTFVEALFLWAWAGGDNDVWRGIEGFEQRRTALSDHLLSVFLRWGRRFQGQTPDDELIFERFEVLASLAHFERNDPTEVLASIQANPQQGWAWMPVGRSGWHGATASKLIAELESPQMFGALMAAGFGSGQANFIEAFILNFRGIAGRMRW